LCDDIMYGCAGDRAFKKFHTTLPAFLNMVRETEGDAAAAVRFFKGTASRGAGRNAQRTSTAGAVSSPTGRA
jgi:hypothetical protein